MLSLHPRPRTRLLTRTKFPSIRPPQRRKTLKTTRSMSTFQSPTQFDKFLPTFLQQQYDNIQILKKSQSLDMDKFTSMMKRFLRISSEELNILTQWVQSVIEHGITLEEHGHHYTFQELILYLSSKITTTTSSKSTYGGSIGNKSLEKRLHKLFLNKQSLHLHHTNYLQCIVYFMLLGYLFYNMYLFLIIHYCHDLEQPYITISNCILKRTNFLDSFFITMKLYYKHSFFSYLPELVGSLIILCVHYPHLVPLPLMLQQRVSFFSHINQLSERINYHHELGWWNMYRTEHVVMEENISLFLCINQYPYQTLSSRETCSFPSLMETNNISTCIGDILLDTNNHKVFSSFHYNDNYLYNVMVNHVERSKQITSTTLMNDMLFFKVQCNLYATMDTMDIADNLEFILQNFITKYEMNTYTTTTRVNGKSILEELKEYLQKLITNAMLMNTFLKENQSTDQRTFIHKFHIMMNNGTFITTTLTRQSKDDMKLNPSSPYPPITKALYYKLLLWYFFRTNRYDYAITLLSSKEMTRNQMLIHECIEFCHFPFILHVYYYNYIYNWMFEKRDLQNLISTMSHEMTNLRPHNNSRKSKKHSKSTKTHETI